MKKNKIIKSRMELHKYICRRHYALAGRYKKSVIVSMIEKELSGQPFYKVKERQIYYILASHKVSVK